MKISVKKEMSSCFETAEYEIDLDRGFEGFEMGDLICYGTPFYPMPLTLEFAIRRDGSLTFRSWKFGDRLNNYFHTSQKPNEFEATEEQIEAVNGLFSGRIKFEGLKIAVGATMQDVCPIDLEVEEERCGKKIYLA